MLRLLKDKKSGNSWLGCCFNHVYIAADLVHVSRGNHFLAPGSWVFYQESQRNTPSKGYIRRNIFDGSKGDGTYWYNHFMLFCIPHDPSCFFLHVELIRISKQIEQTFPNIPSLQHAKGINSITLSTPDNPQLLVHLRLDLGACGFAAPCTSELSRMLSFPRHFCPIYHRQ